MQTNLFALKIVQKKRKEKEKVNINHKDFVFKPIAYSLFEQLTII